MLTYKRSWTPIARTEPCVWSEGDNSEGSRQKMLRRLKKRHGVKEYEGKWRNYVLRIKGTDYQVDG